MIDSKLCENLKIRGIQITKWPEEKFNFIVNFLIEFKIFLGGAENLIEFRNEKSI